MEGLKTGKISVIFGLSFILFVFSIVGVALLSNQSIIEVFKQFLSSTIGSSFGILSMLRRTTHLLMISLGLAIAFSSGVWNLGGEGQILWGGLITVGIALFSGLPLILLLPVTFLASFLVGGGWGLIPGVLKAKWNVNEMVATLMLNFVATATVIQIASGPWQDPLVLIAKTMMIAEEVRLPFIHYPLNVTFLIALAFIPIVYVLMNKTVIGYEMRVVGSRISAAAYAGINPKKIMMLCMFLSGGIVALAGTMIVFGHFFRAETGMTGMFGFYAIVSTLLGRNKPQYMPFTSLLLAFIITGTDGLRVMGIPGTFTDLVVGLLFIIGVIPEIFQRRS